MNGDDSNIYKDFVHVKLNRDFKKTQALYVGEKTEKFCDSTYNVCFFRRAITLCWVFLKQIINDIYS